jgi:hypothetical protein
MVTKFAMLQMGQIIAGPCDGVLIGVLVTKTGQNSTRLTFGRSHENFGSDGSKLERNLNKDGHFGIS